MKAEETNIYGDTPMRCRWRRRRPLIRLDRGLRVAPRRHISPHRASSSGRHHCTVQKPLVLEDGLDVEEIGVRGSTSLDAV